MTGEFFEMQPDHAKNIVIGFICAWKAPPVGVVANQPLVLAGCLDIDVVDQGGRFVRFCDCFQYSDPYVCRCAGLHAGNGPGIRRHHQARRQAAVCLCRSDRAEGHADHPQGLRRRLRRDGLQTPARRCQPRLAERRDRRDGPEGRGGNHLPQDIGDEEKIAARTEEYRKKFANPFIAGVAATSTTSIMPHATRKRVCRSFAMLRNKELENPWRKHGNIPLCKESHSCLKKS